MKDALSTLASALSSSKNNEEKFSDYVLHELLMYVQSSDLVEKEGIVESLRKGSNLTQLPAVLTNPERNDVKR